MKLMSKAGREIQLSDEQAAEFSSLAQRCGESFARAQAFGGRLASQITPEMAAARAQARAAKRAERCRKRETADQQLQRRMAAFRALEKSLPGLHPHVVTRIFHRGRHIVPRAKFGYWQREPEPALREQLADKARQQAESDVRACLGLLNGNDWRRIRPLISNEHFQVMIRHANSEALAVLP